ncbi:hypothetical protein HDU83_000566 [Entophlyctis luteolus]|nr:hypothetical protein HDU83_000566 [Entophlyctis luteolus]
MLVSSARSRSHRPSQRTGALLHSPPAMARARSAQPSHSAVTSSSLVLPLADSFAFSFDSPVLARGVEFPGFTSTISAEPIFRTSVPPSSIPPMTNLTVTFFQKDIPVEIVQSIFLYLDIKAIFRSRLLCKRMNQCLLEISFARIIIKRWISADIDFPSLNDTWLTLPASYKYVCAQQWRSSSLEKLVGFNIKIAGEFGPEIQWLDFLNTLSFSGTGLTGPIPIEIENLVNLKQLSISFTSLNGCIPPSLGKLTLLKILKLRSNNLSGNVPDAALCSLEHLQILDLSKNHLEGPIPSSLWNLRQLVEIRLNDNSFSGSLPSSIGGLPQLKTLAIQNNKLTGYLPSNARGTSVLAFVDMSFNQFEGPIPSCWFRFKNLGHLNFSHNNLHGVVPDCIGVSDSLVVLSLSHNSLSTFHRSIGGFTKLRTLNASNNNLSGVIPEHLASLKFLRELDLSHNRFTGLAKTSDGKCYAKIFSASLNELLLNNNELSEPISAFADSLRFVHKMDLSCNKLFGDLREALGTIRHGESNIQHLLLSHNKLSGNVPIEFAEKFRQLTNLDLSYNALVGVLPRFKFHINVYTAGNNFEIPGIPERELGCLVSLADTSVFSFSELSYVRQNSIFMAPVLKETGSFWTMLPFQKHLNVLTAFLSFRAKTVSTRTSLSVNLYESRPFHLGIQPSISAVFKKEILIRWPTSVADTPSDDATAAETDSKKFVEISTSSFSSLRDVASRPGGLDLRVAVVWRLAEGIVDVFVGDPRRSATPNNCLEFAIRATDVDFSQIMASGPENYHCPWFCISSSGGVAGAEIEVFELEVCAS